MLGRSFFLLIECGLGLRDELLVMETAMKSVIYCVCCAAAVGVCVLVSSEALADDLDPFASEQEVVEEASVPVFVLEGEDGTETRAFVAGQPVTVAGKTFTLRERASRTADGRVWYRHGYDVPLGLFERMREYAKDLDLIGLGGGPMMSEEALKLSFSELGVTWPKGSRVIYVPSIGRLFVKNTGENHRVLDNVLSSTGVPRALLSVELHIVRFEMADIARLAVDGEVTQEELVALREAGQSTLVAAPKVLTKSGCEATIKGVREVIYPTEYTVTPAQAIQGGVAEPGGFETREEGAMLTVIPEVLPEGEMINLTLTPERVNVGEWHPQMVDAGGDVGEITIGQQPFFDTDVVSTSVSVYSGRTVLLCVQCVRVQWREGLPFRPSSCCSSFWRHSTSAAAPCHLPAA